jgi:DDE_Tnp_1-associated
MPGDCPPLLEALAQVEDPRHARGKRHPLPAILALSVAATLCGARGYGAIAEWGRNHGEGFARALGFTRAKTPCAGALHYLFQRLDRGALERVLSTWAEAVLSALPPPPGHLEALAIDGKTLRGSQKQGALEVHLLSVLSHRLGLTLYQQAVAEKTNEIGAMPALLSALLLEGRVVTGDAMLCQREIAQQIVVRGGTTC